jgi:hypothetical protein
MADKQTINLDNIKNPEGLRKILEAMYTEVTALRTLANELRTDHATFKTQSDAVETLIEELDDDHATFVTVVGAIKTLVNDIKSKLDAFVANGMLSSAALAIGSTPQNVYTGLCMYTVAGVVYTKAAVAAGTAPGDDVIPQSKYGAVAFDIGVDGTIDAIKASNNATGYDSSALAVAGLPAAAAGHVRMGYVTAMKSDGDFTFGTTSLADGTSTVAYTSSAGVMASLGAAVSSSPPATLTASKPASAPATLTAPAVTQKCQSGR